VHLLDIWGTGPNDVYAVGTKDNEEYGFVCHYDGALWSKISEFHQWRVFEALWGTGPNDIFVVGGKIPPSVTLMHYDGTTWSDMDPGTELPLNDVWAAAPNDVFAVGGRSGTQNGVVIRYDGSAWSPVHTETAAIQGVWGTDGNDVLVVMDAGRITHFDGATWSSMSSPTTSYLKAIWGTGPNNVFAVGGSGTILLYDGSDWSLMDSGTTEDLYDVRGSGPNDVCAVGNSGTMLHFDGAAWAVLLGCTAMELRGVWTASPSEVFAVGHRRTILHYPTPYAAHPTPYTLTVEEVNGILGSVQILPDLALYAPNTIVTLTANPVGHNGFGGWSGDVPAGHEMDNPLTITMDADKSITATFKCGSGMAPFLPLALAALLGIAVLRRRT